MNTSGLIVVIKALKKGFGKVNGNDTYHLWTLQKNCVEKTDNDVDGTIS